MTKKELDKCLVEIMQGNEDAFAALYEATRKPLFSFLYTYTNDYARTEDLVSDTFIRVRENIGKYRPGSNALAWMFTIAKNLALNEIKKANRSTSYDFAERPDVLGEYNEEYDTPILDATKACLDEEERRIVMLHAVSEYKHKEIAEILGIPLGTVLWKYNRAIKKLKEYLKEDE